MHKNPTNTQYPWTESIMRAALMLSALAFGPLGVSWFTSTKFDLNVFLCMAAYMLTIFAIDSRRRWKNSQQSDQFKSTWYRFSVIELLIICTGLAFVITFAKMGMTERSADHTWQQKVSIKALEYLGTDGSFQFDSNGDVSITICNRDFDDACMRNLADVVAQEKLEDRIHRVVFGTGVKTRGTPAIWDGITDSSIDCLLQWRKLKVLVLHGTSISPKGKENLSQFDSLEFLNL